MFHIRQLVDDQTALPAPGIYVNVLMMFVHTDELLLQREVVLRISRMSSGCSKILKLLWIIALCKVISNKTTCTEKINLPIIIFHETKFYILLC